MFLQEFGRSEKSRLGFGGFADLFDFGGGDHGGFVAEGVTDVGEDGGDFFVGELFEGGHGHLAGVFFAFHLDGAEESVEGEFDEAVFVAIDPFRFGKRREHRGGEPLSIGLVTGGAVALTGVNFLAFFEEGEGFAFERRGGFGHFFAGLCCDDSALKLGGGGFEDRLEPFVDGMGRDFLQDGESFFGRKP